MPGLHGPVGAGPLGARPHSAGHHGAGSRGARVTVVTPNFNMARFLPQTIESVLDNLRPGDEYFIIDGASTDGSVGVIERYAHRLTGWISEPDKGYAHALAKGFDRASGEVLCWINASDVLLRGTLDAAVSELQSRQAELIFGDDFYIDEDSNVIRFSRGHIDDLRAAMLFGGWTPLQDACFWLRGLYLRVGGIDPGLKFAADYDLFLRMALAGRAQYVPMAFSAFRRHPGQKSMAGSLAYRHERIAVRSRELARAPGSRAGKSWRSLVYGAKIRWRERVLRRTWARPDLHSTPIAAMACATYWPISAR